VSAEAPKPIFGRAMPESPMSPRVSSIQFLATVCAMTTKPSVHITNEVARRRSAGMPSGSAIAAAMAAAANRLKTKGVPKCIDSSAEA
jgi:hypothetical protein